MQTFRAQVSLEDINYQRSLNERTEYGDIEPLCATILSLGVQVPIRVVRVKDPATNDGKVYRLDDGFRRVHACRTLLDRGELHAKNGASLKTFEATVIEEADGSQSSLDLQMQSLAINVNRLNWGQLEQASALRKLLDAGAEMEVLAETFGLKPMAIEQRLKLLEAPEDVKAALSRKEINYSAARLLQRVEDNPARADLLKRAVSESFTTRQLNEAIAEKAESRKAEGVNIKPTSRNRRKSSTGAVRVKPSEEVIGRLEAQQDNLSEANDPLVRAELTGAIKALQWVISPSAGGGRRT